MIENEKRPKLGKYIILPEQAFAIDAYFEGVMRHIQYQGETLPAFPLVLAFHLVFGKFHIYFEGVRSTDEDQETQC